MKKDEIIQYLRNHGLSPTSTADRVLKIRGYLIRCKSADISIAAVGSEAEDDLKIKALVDAVHWHIQTRGSSGNLLFVLGSNSTDDSKSRNVINAIAHLFDSLTIPIDLKVEVNFKPYHLRKGKYNEPKGWLKYFGKPGLLEIDPPPIAIKLEEIIDDKGFQWHRNITKESWKGYAKGLPVCEINKSGTSGKYSCKRVKIDFNMANLNEIADRIKRDIEARITGKLNETEREGLLESMIRIGEIQLHVKEKPLVPVYQKYQFQLPTLWAPKGSTKFLDLLMRSDQIPYAVELKIADSSTKKTNRATYYRHGIAQAALYREFIRNDDRLHNWFDSQSLNARECNAALAFPKMDLDDLSQRVLAQHKKVAAAFDVDIIEVDKEF
jgi:hypothetical protein